MFPISWMCLIWLNMHIFYWRLVLIMSLSMQAVMIYTLLNFSVSFWLDIASKIFWNIVGYFMPMMRIQKFVLFISKNAWFHGMLFADWDVYDILWCSEYCNTMPMGVPLGGKLTLTSNISSLIKGWYEMSGFNILREELFVPSIC